MPPAPVDTESAEHHSTANSAASEVLMKVEIAYRYRDQESVTS